MAAPHQRHHFLELLETLANDPTATVVPPTQTLFDKGIELYRNRPDKEWSLTDCVSFVVMDDMRIEDALTADHHFEQAGFRALLL